MKVLKTGLVSAAMLAATMASPATSADLSSYGGSLKDEPIHEVHEAVGGCYLRGNIGYGWNDADATEFDSGQAYQSSELEDNASFGAGIGCARSRGLRLEMLYTFHGDNHWSGVPAPPDPIFAHIETHSLMANIYYDWDMGRRFKPYVGAGIGVAHHDMSALDCAPAIPGVCTPGAFQRGGENVTLAWSVMTGVGFEMTDRITLDVGYRYTDMGDVESNRMDENGFTNPIQQVQDIQSHELLFGIRFAMD